MLHLMEIDENAANANALVQHRTNWKPATIQSSALSSTLDSRVNIYITRFERWRFVDYLPRCLKLGNSLIRSPFPIDCYRFTFKWSYRLARREYIYNTHTKKKTSSSWKTNVPDATEGSNRLAIIEPVEKRNFSPIQSKPVNDDGGGERAANSQRDITMRCKGILFFSPIDIEDHIKVLVIFFALAMASSTISTNRQQRGEHFTTFDGRYNWIIYHGGSKVWTTDCEKLAIAHLHLHVNRYLGIDGGISFFWTS